MAGPQFAQSRRGDHRGVVGRELKAWKKRRDLASVATLLQFGSEPAVRRDTAGNADALRLISPRSVEQAIEQRGDDNPLKAGADVGDLLFGKRSRSCFHVARNSRFQAAEAEVEIAFETGCVSIGMREACRRKLDRSIVAAVRQRV